MLERASMVDIKQSYPKTIRNNPSAHGNAGFVPHRGLCAFWCQCKAVEEKPAAPAAPVTINKDIFLAEPMQPVHPNLLIITQLCC